MSDHTRPHQAEKLAHLLVRLREADRNQDQRVSVDEVLTELGDRAFGPLLFIIGALQVLPTGMLPGVTGAMGLLTVLVAAQLLLSMRTPAVPQRVRSLSLEVERFHAALTRLERWATWADTRLRPRLGLIVTPLPARILIALACIACGLIILVVGVVPGPAVLPALGICCFGTGILFGDGVAIAAGFAITLTSLAIAGYLLLQLV